MTRLTRRNFLKGTGMAALALGTGATLDAVLSGCATSGPNERPFPSKTQPETPVYPPLAAKKIQPPENGCLVGLMRHYATISYTGQVSKNAGRIIDYYQDKLGKKPAFFSLCCGVGFTYFPYEEMEGLATRGVIPNILPEYPRLDEIAKGSYDTALTTVAKEATKYGKQHGGFFYSPMRELNGYWFQWGQQPTQAKKAWQHVWQIFQDQGANEYATWVWEIECPEAGSARVDSPDSYYPGDKHVDWIGLSAYSRAQFNTRDMSYNELTRNTYSEMHNNHKEKPIMQAEFASTQGSSQPYWLKNAFKTIKSRPGMKAALYWDWPNVALGDEHDLSDESYGVLKEIFKDPYFIGAK
jgi:hypothetical protein